MPESDQWNGDDELPVSHHGDLASETAISVAGLTGSQDNELVSDDPESGDEEKPEGSQGDANKAEQGKTTEEREEKKSSQAEKKAEKKNEDKAVKPGSDKSAAADPRNDGSVENK